MEGRSSDWRLFWGWIIVGIFLPWGAWLRFHTPTAGKAGMLLAFVATVVPLVWEGARAFCRAGLVFTLVVLVAVEYRAINEEHKKSEDDTRTLIKNTQTTVDQFKPLVEQSKASTDSLSSLVTQLGFLTSQMATAQKKLADLDVKINAAREKHDPALIANLQAEAVSERQVLNSISNRVLTTLVPPIITQMQNLVADWKFQDENAYRKADNIHFIVPRRPQAEIDEVMANLERNNAQRAIAYRARAKDTVIFANALRKEMLQRLPPSQRNKQDEDANGIFEKLIGGDYSPRDLENGIGYLEGLGQRLSKM